MMHTKIAILSIFLAIAALSTAEKKIICYYGSWAKDNSGEGKFPITSLDVNLCTHVVFSFVRFNHNGVFKLFDYAKPADLSSFTKYVKGNGAKALLSVGGASVPSKKFSKIVANAESRHRFVESAVNYLKKYNFDGLDVDWEYPNQIGGKHADKNNFVELLKELKQAFSSHGYSLSAAVGAEQDSASKSYKISKIAQYLDFINVMTYDFNGYDNGHTGINSPLYASAKDKHDDKQLNIDASIRYWLKQGAPANKLIVGIPFYGITFTLKDKSNHGLHAPISGPGKKGPFTDDEGNIGYNEMCVDLKKGGWTVVRDRKEDAPYAYKGKQWVSYDDPSSIRLKAEYAKSQNLGGVMIWSVDTDDFHGNCGPKNALLKAINEVL